MRFLKYVWWLTVGVWGAAFAAGQNVPRPPATVAMAGYDARGSGLPANSPSTLLNFTVEGDATGGNAFHVVTSVPGVIVSLILPSGLEITSSNASSFGFTYTVLPDNTGADVESVLSLPGTHISMQIPAGQVSGVYSIKVNATNVNTDSAILASYYPSSNVHAAVTTNSSTYKVGDTVVLSGLVFDSATPITGATVTAAVSTPLSLASQTSVGNPQLVSQQSVGPNLTEYQYTFTLTNTGSTVREVQAALASIPQNVSVVNDILLFGDIAANSTTTSISGLTIQRDPSLSFDPSTLQWNVTATGPVNNVSLTDSGALDAASGDGIYTGTFTPSAPGIYTVLLSVTGNSLAGNGFSRTAIASFEVTAQQLASFTGFADTQQSNGITTTANINVVTPGTYRFSMQMRASNQTMASGSATANLAVGSQQIAIVFPNSSIYQLGVGGPYERVNALLVFSDGSGEKIADSKADAGPTAAYTLGSFAPQLYFTGQNSASGVITGGGPTFDLLQVQIGVSSATALASCAWSAGLTDSAGNQIDFANGRGSVPAGASSVMLSFNGPRIAASAGGPYTVKPANILCGSAQANIHTLFTIQGFPPSQFTSAAPTFTLSLVGSSPSGAAGSSVAFPLLLSTAGPFSGNVTFTVSGLPSGATGSFNVIGMAGPGPLTLTVATPSNLAGGAYPFTVRYLTGTVSHTLSLNLAITSSSQVATPAFSPAAGKYASFPTVTISTTTSGASIRYTTDGSTPSETAGTLYSGPVRVSSTATIMAIAFKSGMADSAVASATYTISPVATPTFSPAAGKYTSFPAVIISTTTSGTSIRYTTDGSTPSETVGTLYSGPITVSSTTTIKAIAYGSGMIDSAVASATYTISPVATPTFSPAAGKYASTQTIAISTTTSGASIRYTNDGSAPSETVGTLYSGPITISSTTTIKAIAYGSGMIDSAVASATYTITQ
jgi:hypothetical protein